MKRIFKTAMPVFGRACSKLCFGTAVLILLTINLITINTYAQTPPPPNGGDNPTQSGNTPVGGGAAIGGGLLILTLLGVAYGVKKVYTVRKKTLSE